MTEIPRHALGLVLAAGSAFALSASADTLQDVMQARGLSQQDVLAAAKTYVPTGGRDEFVVFSSGGQSGQVIVYGIPSMRILKYIAVFTPEPWQGYGFDESSKAVLNEGRIDGKEHHLGRYTPSGDVGNRRQVRRPVPVHQRQGQPAHRRDRPARLRDQADRRESDLQVGAWRHLRDAEHRLHHRNGPVRHTAGEQEVLSAGGVQRQVPRRHHLLEVRPQGRAASSPSSPFRSNCRPIRRICRTPARAPRTAGRSPTPSAPSVTSAASRRGVRPSRPAVPPRTRTTCT